MGSRPPRQQPLPRAPRHTRPIDARQPETQPPGLRMEVVTPFLGLTAFPVAIVASFIAYAATSDISSIAAAVILTALVAAGLWLALRQMTRWRGTARMTNELLLAILVGVIGMGIMLGGVAGLSPAWAAMGLAVIVGAWLIQRLMPRATS